jgi:diguanylate cyclase (GGDEF)-like protein
MPYVLGMIGLGTGIYLACLPFVVQSPPETWRILAVVALCSMAELPLVERRVGHNTEAFTFAEIFLLLGLVLVPAPALVVLCSVSVLVFHLLSKMAPMKALFNGAACAVGAALAGAVHALVAGDSPHLGARDLGGVVLGTLAFHVWNSVAISGAMSRAQAVPFRSIYAQGALMRTVVCAGNVGVGVFIVVVGHWNTRVLLLLPPILVVVYLLYRGYLRANQERDVWRQLEVATRELNVLDEKELVASALRRAQQLFRTDTVELLLTDGDAMSSSRLFVLDGDDVVRESVTSAAPLAPRSGMFLTLDEEGEQQGLMTCLVAPLDGPKGSVGALRLIFGGPVKFRGRERQVLRTFAHSVGSSLQNVALYSAMRDHAQTMAHEASHDALTGLGNRTLLHDKAVATLAGAGPDWQCALLIVDLDHFKEINDTLGHAAGDVFLQQVGQRIVGCVPQAEAVCRLGGDEFAVLISGLRTSEHADAVAAQLLAVLAEPVSFDGLRLSIEGSVGVACYPADASSFDELLRRADVALYQAKTSRGSFSHYRVDRDESSLHRLALAAELRTALSEDQFVAHFQPQYDLATGQPVGAEALVRWQHPKRGLLAPGEFVGAVEHSGLIRDFTMVVLEKAVAECASWAADGSTLTVAVNLSARNLLDSELPTDVGRVLLKHGLQPDRLILEITETTMMSELEVVEEVLGSLRTMGVQLSVDDFGTGYSSLAFLQRVAVNEVKIDRSFVAGLGGSDSDRALVRATVQLAHSLGARAVAEGVEDESLAEALRQLGCDFAQGYHLGRPVPADELRKALGLRQRHRAVPAPRTEPDSRHLRAVSGS